MREVEREGKRESRRRREGGRGGGNSIVFWSYFFVDYLTSKTCQPYRRGNSHRMGISLDLETPPFPAFHTQPHKVYTHKILN